MKDIFLIESALQFSCITFICAVFAKSDLSIENEDKVSEHALKDDRTFKLESTFRTCNFILFNPNENLDIIFDEKFDDGFNGWNSASNVIIVNESSISDTRTERQKVIFVKPTRSTLNTKG